MRKRSPKFTTICAVFGVFAVGGLLAVLTWIVFAEYHRSRHESQDANARGRLAQLQLCIENYRSVNGRALQRIYIDSQGKRTSWREKISPYFDDETMRTMVTNPERVEGLRNGDTDQFAPASLRVTFDTSNAHFTSIVAVYDELNADDEDAPWAIVAMTNTGVRWNEPKDLTVSEFLKRLDAPQAAKQPVAVLTASGQLGSIVNGSSLRFSLLSPGQSPLRTFLLREGK
eukprot:TRINITY_DN2893_c0_g1_i13.p1 TRINITY_DN2893_c0_g1~~TRINITY_DN2893_c0_g1_i13.p1  ORF type:complete len:229 (+),score=20.00 TRINITY_DN2893_c0_g1_i13:283-969(+)